MLCRTSGVGPTNLYIYRPPWMSYQGWEALENETYKNLFQLSDSPIPDKFAGKDKKLSYVQLWKITCLFIEDSHLEGTLSFLLRKYKLWGMKMKSRWTE